MKITLIAVGRAKDGPEAALVSEYQKRLPWKLEVIEVVEKSSLQGKARIVAEGEKILSQAPKGAFVVALDKAGSSFSSEQLAVKIGKWFQAGGAHIVFVIGGPEGLSPAVLDKTDAKLSLGPMTWPHLLARVMLIEQLYRAWAIQTGHPYHK